MALTATTLPPEIRYAIFEHALSPTHEGDIRTIDSLNLLAASKQIYHEAGLLPFQSNTISLPATTGSSTSATVRLLQRLSPTQLKAIRKLDLHVVGSTLDTAAAAKVLRHLRLGRAQGDVVLDPASHCLPPEEGDLRELTVTVSSRDIAIPLADCRAGLQKALEVETSPLFAWIATFDKLRKLRLRVRVLRDEQFPKAMREELQTALDVAFGTQVQPRLDFEAVQTPDCIVDDLEVHYPDSYVGILGNICTVPVEFQDMFNGVEWAFG